MTARFRNGIEGAHQAQTDSDDEGVAGNLDVSGTGLVFPSPGGEEIFHLGGCYSIRCSYFGRQHAVLAGGASEIYVRDYTYLYSALPAQTQLGAHHIFNNGVTGGSSGDLIVRTASTGRMNLYLGSWQGIDETANRIAFSDENVIVPDVWQKIDYYIKVADSGGRFVAKVDDVTVIDFTGDTQNSITDLTHFALVGYESSSVFHDDHGINDVSGSLNNSWLPTATIVSLLPDVAALADVPPDDGTFVDATTGTRQSAFVSTPLGTLTAGSPVVLWLRCQRQAGTPTATPYLRIGGINYDGSAISAPAAFDYIYYVWNVNPATSSAWTAAEVNALEFGWLATGDTVRASQMFLEVEGAGGSGCGPVPALPGVWSYA